MARVEQLKADASGLRAAGQVDADEAARMQRTAARVGRFAVRYLVWRQKELADSIGPAGVRLAAEWRAALEGAQWRWVAACLHPDSRRAQQDADWAVAAGEQVRLESWA